MTCDADLIQEVSHATYTLKYVNESDGKMLPDEVEVIYSCNHGYIMKTDIAAIGCYFETSSRSGSSDAKEKITIAKWNDTSHIVSEEGISLLSFNSFPLSMLLLALLQCHCIHDYNYALSITMIPSTSQSIAED